MLISQGFANLHVGSSFLLCGVEEGVTASSPASQIPSTLSAMQ